MVVARGGPQKLVRRFYKAAAAGDIRAAAALLDENFRTESGGILPWGGIHEGRAAVIANVLGPLATAIDLGSVSIQSIYGEGDRVFATVTAATAGGEKVVIGEDWTVKGDRLGAVRVFWVDPTPLVSPRPAGAAATS